MPRALLTSLALITGLSLLPHAALADSATLAVATNFAPTAEKLAANFAEQSGHQITVTGGATGKLYAQIGAGAPFDAFLSADRKTAEKLVTDGLAVSGSRFTYATGRLALWSADPARDLSDPKAALLSATHVAIANPDLAPYGKAAMETIEKLGLTADLKAKIVTGENIGQAQSMVASGAAELGFVAAPALVGGDEGAAWPVPADSHAPLRQDAVLLTRGAGNAAAEGFLAYLAGPEAQKIITDAGYGTD